MNLIDDFALLYGKDVCQDIYNFMVKNKIIDDFNKIYYDQNLNKLFMFALHHGILYIVEYLYEYRGIKYDLDTITQYNINFRNNSNAGILLITHYNRILQYIKPDKVTVMMNGKIIKEDETGKLADEIEARGYTEYIPTS